MLLSYLGFFFHGIHLVSSICTLTFLGVHRFPEPKGVIFSLIYCVPCLFFGFCGLGIWFYVSFFCYFFHLFSAVNVMKDLW